VLARELDGPPALLVAESPTRGLDSRVTAAAYVQLRTARDRGAAIVLFSPDLDELLALASRLIVVHARQVREVEADREAVSRALLGVS